MKKILGLIISIFLFLFSPSCVSAVSDYERIDSFESNIIYDKNTDIEIEEEIHYHFSEYRHGIYRYIPVDYQVEGLFKRPVSVTLNDLYYYKSSDPSRKYSNYERSKSNGNVEFKIGDADTTIIGDYVFVIKYTLRDAVNYFDTNDEFYLNITGNGWDVPILSSSANIKVPGNIEDMVCYSGITGSTSTDCTLSKVSTSEVNVSMTKPLYEYSGYTVALKMPKGTLDDIRARQVFEFILANIGILLPIPAIILGFFLLKKAGKNKKITIIPNYNPPKGINPLYAGYLMTNSLSTKYITAQIIHLAINGFIKIKQLGKNDYELLKNNEYTGQSSDSVNALYDGIFKNGRDSVNLKKLGSDFYKTTTSVQNKVDSELYKGEYLSTVRRGYKGWLLYPGIGMLILAFFLLGPSIESNFFGWVLGMALSGIIFIIFATRIDLKSILGNEIYYDLLGLKMYINTAEKHRIEFHNDPKKYIGLFEKLLPFTMIFGLEKKWAGEFEDMYNRAPDWYEGDFSTFNTYMLLNSFSRMNTEVQKQSMPPSSHGASGGSGFSGGSSGGGFGGGGGGSW